MQSNDYNASIDIADKYASLPRSSSVLELITNFEQGEFMKKNLNPKYLSNNLSKALLEDHHAEGAAEGICAAAVMHWLDTGTVPSPTEAMAAKLAQVQGSFDTDNERDYLKWCSNLSDPSQTLTRVKDSKGIDLDDTQKFINYLLDSWGKINTKLKLFLILSFKQGGKPCAHAVGWNLGTRSFFDPNYGVWKVNAPKPKNSILKIITFSNDSDPATVIACSIIGLDEIRKKYGDPVSVQAITF
ncbi:hypothetical protein CPAR01_07369 [Colletotrichum paranaense]|uniref:Uncharacterized protein n=1 Tax=Colletotrichum paranaense TaxID=1914294 RepID=A0ABQ9SPF7_9PEZI|nr:uncharacterized protein CPAR01_07369 [Colletotrichum paranaense]KAK1541380.1 hypothetical protein CPAR01_07369 [Colletotrichum paranaense]